MRILKRLKLRNDNATDRVVEEIIRGRNNPLADAMTTSALETAAGIIGRALMSARVISSGSLVTPSVLFAIGRSLVRHGEYVAVETGGRLIQTTIHRVTGGTDRDGWRYELAFKVPDGRRATKVYSESDFLFVKYIDDGIRGQSPINIADTSSRILGNLTERVAEESGTPVGYLLPIPARDGASANVAGLRNSIAQMAGRVLTVESAQSLANTAGFTRTSGWKTERLGMDIPVAVVSLMERIYNEVLSLCGIPLAIVTQSSQREAWRQFLFGTISPIGKLIEQEFQSKLGSEFRLEFDELRASDITGRARAFNSMVSSGMDLTQAAGLSGLLAIEE